MKGKYLYKGKNPHGGNRLEQECGHWPGKLTSGQINHANCFTVKI